MKDAARNNGDTRLIVSEFQVEGQPGVFIEMKTKSTHGRWVQPGGYANVVAIPLDDIDWVIDQLRRYKGEQEQGR